MAEVIRIAPYQYIHVLNNNTNVTRVECGPQTFTKQDHERVALQPTAMVVIPPRHYCIIANPVMRDQNGEVSYDQYNQARLRYGDRELRFSFDCPEPFYLFPGEQMVGAVTELQVVPADSALRLVARRNFLDTLVDAKEPISRLAGDEWLFEGPRTYIPRVEVEVIESIAARVIKPDTALKIRARRECFDRNGIARKSGEEWLVREEGTYLPSVDEVVVDTIDARILLLTKALHLRAVQAFTDVYGKDRKAGEEWIITSQDTDRHIPDVYEEVVGEVNRTVLNRLQYCVVLDPVGADGKNQYGARELRRGESSFFLLPGERLEGGIRNMYVLGDQEALLLRARERFADESKEGAIRTPGDLWMIYGPCDYVPPVEVEVVEKRVSIPLDENEGIYVRDIKTGRVRSQKGRTYMLEAHEELWSKELPDDVERLLANGGTLVGDDEKGVVVGRRDKTRVVSFRIPTNSAMQIYDYKAKQSRVVFGPGLVMLEPDEMFTMLSLSGGKPKRPNVIKSLYLQLGPDFMTDIFTVETADHARLRLRLSCNWTFELDIKDEATPTRIFQVRDFVGDACKAVAARVRNAVAAEPFDHFHQNSAKIIRAAVFGFDAERNKIGDRFVFHANGLVITNIDIQSVEPVDERTLESLQKSVQLAIEITTKNQERKARHAAEQTEQEARGRIERQKIANQTEAEKERQELVQLQAESAAISSTGTAKAEARAKAEFLEIEGQTEVAIAEKKAEASDIEARAELAELTAAQAAEVKYQEELAALESSKRERLASIESKKFKAIVTAISPSTLQAIARAGPEMQARLLKSLGLKGYLVTDGTSPINLFQTASGMIGAGGVPNVPNVRQ
eukprot:TRINITY_DN386_c0_g3_i1.p1 TRINITY_DN386_c0_g3~~TRINITY_DN386_c0_g3_i1.p1  ORF type:complete len:870 (-),score=435.91 TRINITY_DN386_c0_g3_i1:104-2656(-)